MIKSNLPHGRGPQILKVLAEHGPLSTRGLLEILAPQTNATRLREVLQRLQRKKFVLKMFDKHFGGTGVFYKITQSDEYWPEIAKIVDCNPKLLFQPQFRKAELIHSERCAVWVEKLKQLLPDAQMIRDYMISSSESAKACLQSYGDDKELLPDILAILPSHAGNKPVNIAFEIERTIKSGRRITHKLKKYCNESKLDGVIYICEDTAIAKRVRTIYRNHILKDALTINNYGDNFILFQDSVDASDLAHAKTYNSALMPVNLYSWFQQLLRYVPDKRYDSTFAVQLSTTGRFCDA